MATVTFALKEPNTIDDSLILLLLRFNGVQWKFSTEQKIIPKYWNVKTRRAREVRSFPYSELNTILTNMESAVLDTFRKLINDKERITKDKIKVAIDTVLGKDILPNNKKDFFTFIDNYIETTNKKESTKHTYRQTVSILKKYQEDLKTTLTFDSIDLDFYERFTKYLAKEDYQDNTIGKFIKKLKSFMNEAFERGLTSNVIFKHKKFKSVNAETESIYLTEPEITKLYKLNLSDNKGYENVRDLFIIGCYTGLRFSDLCKLSDKNLIDKGTKIKIQTEKTGELVVIPLHTYVLEILKKRGGEFPETISNQKTNEYLKAICEKAKLSEKVPLHFVKGGVKTTQVFKKFDLVTMHTARRSFATNAYLKNMPTISIMKITGHRTEKAFLSYIKISQEDNANKLLNHPFFK